MVLAHSKLTAQGQISVPAEVRRKLGLGPGAILEWEEEDGEIVVRKAGRYSSADIRRALFGKKKPPAARTVQQMDEAIAKRMKKRHARD
jgi:antitoxin PrlF